MALKDIISQDRAVRILVGTLRRDRLPSALLFSGDAGIGKKLAAVNYAKAINCLDPVGFDCCDACSSCGKIDSKSHPDVTMVVPENEEIKIETIRRTIETLAMKPFEGRKKVVIMDDADAMNSSAANAFLKTLEEPPTDSHIILLSSNPDDLPGTIRSRCINIRFYPLPRDKCREVISRGVTGTVRDDVLNLAMGRPGLALSTDLVGEKESFMRFLKNMVQGQSKDVWADKVQMRSWFDLSSILLRDMAVFSITGKKSDLLYGSDYTARDLESALDAYERFTIMRGLTEVNINKAITWNYVSMLMQNLMSGSLRRRGPAEERVRE